MTFYHSDFISMMYNSCITFANLTYLSVMATHCRAGVCLVVIASLLALSPLRLNDKAVVQLGISGSKDVFTNA